ncbi:hypothetical protein AB0300_03775 [Microbacterium sp. NPDC078814]|uniref:hypothetical protein n=1 Tax=Microbacterium sp. NPDC078814 TaxID=3154767 RepID=UPI0028E6BC99|nr:hypothetical protein [uncultured Microbacterium sp.]
MKGIVVTVISALIGAALLTVLIVLGVPAAFAVAWTLLLLAVVAATRQVFVDEAVVWPPEAPRAESRGSDVSRMAWAINTRTGVAGHVVVRRVQGVVRRRLAHRGLDLDDPDDHPRIDAMLGDGVRASLHARDVQRADIERVLDALDRIPTDTEETS